MIPVSKPLLGETEKQGLLECIDSGWISSSGPIVKKFEEEFSRSVGRRYGIGVANGTAALEIALTAAGIGPGAEVLMPAFTIISCAAAVVKTGATPVLVDSDPRTWNMTVEGIEEKITARTRAILVVHTYGLPADMDPLTEIAERHGLMIIEDAAEAHGLAYRDRPCGSFGIVSTFSFYANKNITTGEGGMIVTDNAAMADTCRQLRNLCFQPARRFIHDRIGWNYRLTSLQAALGIAQLKKLPMIVCKKTDIGKRYLKAFADLPHVSLPPVRTPYADNTFWVFGLVIEQDDISATAVMQALHHCGIETRPFFWPMHRQPVLQKQKLFERESYPVSERLGQQGFYIPSGPDLTPYDQNKVIAAVQRVFDEKF